MTHWYDCPAVRPRKGWLRRAVESLRALLDANFGESDLHLTLTYRGTPPSYEQAKRHVQNFLRAVKRMREKAGLSELKYVYVIEEEGGDGEKRRIHVHLVMNGGLDRGAVEGMWGRGYANCDRLQPEDGDGLRQLARYLTKCEMEKHRRAWCASKNLRKRILPGMDCTQLGAGWNRAETGGKQ